MEQGHRVGEMGQECTEGATEID